MFPSPAPLYIDNTAVGVAVGGEVGGGQEYDRLAQIRISKGKNKIDEQGEPDSEDEYDIDTQSLGQGTVPGEDMNTSYQHPKGPLLHTSNVDDITDVTGKQGLSPRGRKMLKQNKQASTSKPNTRARSRGL
ncbi:hypothetical protein EJD97_021202 [Solanum chilense]|uniref:Uncharacterized protein n=1 Tax=Solanum chilense TaxID=4083 RepID=A0A6N2AXT4_SOLCI|nr:hypothetical protein EJD97_021202 [Solanum chilense]